MGAIFGYTGKESAKEILVSGLLKLRRNEKDMAGIVLKDENAFASIKIKGTPEELASKIKQLESESTTGIAECSREERCKASSITAPPCANEAFAAAIDGEIENFTSLKKWCAEPFLILSEEDLLLACLSLMNEESKISLIERLSKTLLGNPSFAFISSDENAIYCKSGESRLVIGFSSSGCFISSELGAILPFCEKYAFLENGETAKLLNDKITVFDSKMKRIKKAFLSPPAQSYLVNNYVQSDEIYCLPLALRETFSRFVKNQQPDFDFLKLGSRYIERIDKIILIGSGSSKNTALAAKGLFETYCSVTTLAEGSAEFLYSKAPIDKNTLVIAISQSGENTSTYLAVKKAKFFHAKTIALTGNKNSSIACECGAAILTRNDNEETAMKQKIFISDFFALCLFAFYLGSRSNIISDLYLGVSLKMGEMLSGIVSAVIKSSPRLEAAASILGSGSNAYVTCENPDCSMGYEAARIIRETTNKNAQAVCTEELCDYPAELLASATVFILINDKEQFQKEMKNICRIKNRSANVIVITSESIEEEIEDFENIISFTDSLPVFNPIPCIASVYKIALLSKENTELDSMTA